MQPSSRLKKIKHHDTSLQVFAKATITSFTSVGKECCSWTPTLKVFRSMRLFYYPVLYLLVSHSDRCSCRFELESANLTLKNFRWLYIVHSSISGEICIKSYILPCFQLVLEIGLIRLRLKGHVSNWNHPLRRPDGVSNHWRLLLFVGHRSSITVPRYWPFVRGIHRWPVDSPHKGPVTRKMFPYLMTSSGNLQLIHLVTSSYVPEFVLTGTDFHLFFIRSRFI